MKSVVGVLNELAKIIFGLAIVGLASGCWFAYNLDWSTDKESVQVEPTPAQQTILTSLHSPMMLGHQ